MIPSTRQIPCCNFAVRIELCENCEFQTLFPPTPPHPLVKLHMKNVQPSRFQLKRRQTSVTFSKSGNMAYPSGITICNRGKGDISFFLYCMILNYFINFMLVLPQTFLLILIQSVSSVQLGISRSDILTW